MPRFSSLQLESKDTNMAISEQGTRNKMIEPKMYDIFLSSKLWIL